jgi:hypothetical protein
MMVCASLYQNDEQLLLEYSCYPFISISTSHSGQLAQRFLTKLSSVFQIKFFTTITNVNFFICKKIEAALTFLHFDSDTSLVSRTIHDAIAIKLLIQKYTLPNPHQTPTPSRPRHQNPGSNPFRHFLPMRDHADLAAHGLQAVQGVHRYAQGVCVEAAEAFVYE